MKKELIPLIVMGLIPANNLIATELTTLKNEIIFENESLISAQQPYEIITLDNNDNTNSVPIENEEEKESHDHEPEEESPMEELLNETLSEETPEETPLEEILPEEAPIEEMPTEETPLSETNEVMPINRVTEEEEKKEEKESEETKADNKDKTKNENEMNGNSHLEPVAGSEYVSKITSDYENGVYSDFIEEMESLFEAHAHEHTMETSKEESIFWANIEAQQAANQKDFMEKLALFAQKHPLTSLGKMVEEFVNFSLTEEEKLDIHFITSTLTAFSSKLYDACDSYLDDWKSIKAIAYRYKIMHILLNEQYISEDKDTEELRALHIVLDLAMRNALISHLSYHSPLTSKIEGSFAAYFKYLSHEYNMYFLASLLNGERKALSEGETYIKQLMNEFQAKRDELVQSQLEWIHSMTDQGYSEL